MARFRRTLPVNNDIPTASMADIAFLLLIFFMATTIFRLEEGLPVTLPRAEAGQTVPRQTMTHVGVMDADRITIDDAYVNLVDIVPILAAKEMKNPSLIVGVNIDRRVPWQVAAQVIEMLKEAKALNASFTVEREPVR
jgi:biopolymer transport protein ExbD